MTAGTRSALTVDGRDVPVSSLNRPLWRTPLVRKRDLLGYYLRVSDVLLPHLTGRPATLHRFPEGIVEGGFYQTRCPPHPSWVRTQRMHVFTSGKDVDAPVIDDLPSLVWAVNLSTVEFHPFLGTAARLVEPTSLVFDLDPGPPADRLDAARLALAIRDVLVDHRLVSYVKSTGGKGLHVHVPLAPGHGYAETKAFARTLARAFARSHPERVTDVMTVSRRAGKVFVDWSQNDPGKSTVAPYSLRGGAVPTVAAPLRWSDLEAAVEHERGESLVVTVSQVLTRLERLGDPFAGMGDVHQYLPGVTRPGPPSG